MSLDNATPREWDRVSKTSVGKLYHPNDKHNPVTQPDHYNRGAIEAIEAIKASMHPQEFKGYLKGNCLKYLWRYEYKNGQKRRQKGDHHIRVSVGVCSQSTATRGGGTKGKGGCCDVRRRRDV
jgi:hypothetical protein